MPFKGSKRTFGLILVGGKSSRMGREKHLITYHDIPQYLHLHNLLSKICDEVYVSCSAAQKEKFNPDIKTIIDTTQHQGPLNAIKNAFTSFEANWLVVPCDMPNITSNTLAKLTSAKEDKAILCAIDDQNIINPLLAYYHLKNKSLMRNYEGNSATDYAKKIGYSTVKLSKEESINVNSTEEYENYMRNHG